MKYAFAALARNEFEGLPLICTPSQLRTVTFGEAEDGGAQQFVQICPIPSGDAYLDALNIQSVLTIPVCQLLLGAMALVFTLLAYGGLVLTSRRAISKIKGGAIKDEGGDEGGSGALTAVPVGNAA